jgi:pimeloyl-ACP methyl ester carboxylesterase
VVLGSKGKIALRVVLGLLVFVLVVVFGVAPWLLTRMMMTRRFAFPDRENAGLTPATFEIPFEEVAFAAADGTALSGWWVPATGAPRGAAVLVHGLNRSRIEMARKVPFLHAHGYSVLVLDLRHHGRSAGDLSSFGYFERQDVRAAVELAHRRTAGPIVVWGVSMGAAAAALAAAEDPRIAGVVCDSAYRSLPDTVRHHLDLARQMQPWLRPLPAGLLTREVLFWIARRGGFDPAELDVRRAAAKLGRRPALFVCNYGDRRMPREIAFELQAAAGARARVLVLPGSRHAGGYRDGTAAYEKAVEKLLEEVGEPS